jgi:predicted permease
VFAVTAIVTLALGIGSVTAMFAIVHGVLLAPLRYGNANELVAVSTTVRSPELRRIQQPQGIFFTYKRLAHDLENVGFYRTGSGNISNDDGASEAERVTTTWVSASTIPTLQVPAALGRPFTSEEDSPHGPYVVMLSNAIWRTRFNASPDVIGKTLIINSVPRKIVGVMPPDFEFPTRETAVWLPTRLDSNSNVVGDFTYSAVARLAPGVTPDQAQRELASLLPRMAESYPRLESAINTSAWLGQAKPAPVVVPLRDEITGGIARTLWILGAAAGLVLLVACANVANLMLIRADSRQLELAVREALGAGRLRVLTHFLGESVVIATTAGALSLAAAWAAVHAVVTFGPADIPRLSELSVGPATVAFALVVSLIIALVCSAIPAFRARRASLSISLRDGGRSDTAGKARQRLRGVIASLQMAVALVVLAGSALLLRTFHRLYEERPGFDATNVATFWMQLPYAHYGNDSSAVRFFARLTASVRAVPGVRAAGVTTLLPLGSGEASQRSFRVDGDAQVVSLPSYTIDDGYFAAMSIPLIAGRGFAPIGVQRGGEVIVSRQAAATLWHDPTGWAAVGKRLGMAPAGPTYTVIGVAGDVRDRDLATPPAATVYVPQGLVLDATLEPSPPRNMALVVKTVVTPTSVVGSVRRIVRDLDPTVPTYDDQAMTDVVRASTSRLSFTLALMATAAVITLLLGAIGLYGVMAYMVALRTREFGLRVALGADPRLLARTVALRGLVLIAAGVGAGLVMFAIAARFLQAFLYGVSVSDPLTIIGATLALVATASLANWLPARRAAQVDPAEALRSD